MSLPLLGPQVRLLAAHDQGRVCPLRTGFDAYWRCFICNAAPAESGGTTGHVPPRRSLPGQNGLPEPPLLRRITAIGSLIDLGPGTGRPAGDRERLSAIYVRDLVDAVAPGHDLPLLRRGAAVGILVHQRAVRRGALSDLERLAAVGV